MHIAGKKKLAPLVEEYENNRNPNAIIMIEATLQALGPYESRTIPSSIGPSELKKFERT
jgi:hypothetical protein